MAYTIEPYMWGYQRHFQICYELFCKNLFNKLDHTLFDNFFLIGVLDGENDDKVRHSICLEPADCGYDKKDFQNTLQLSNMLASVSPEKNVFYSHPIAQDQAITDIKNSSIRESIIKHIDGEYQSKQRITHVPYPIKKNGYFIFLVLQFNKNTFLKYYKLTNTKYNDFHIHPSFIDATTLAFFELASKELYSPNAGRDLGPRGHELEGVLKNAASMFTSTLTLKMGAIEGIHGLYNACNIISSLRYEGEEGVGRMVVAPKDHKNIKMLITLDTPIRMSEYAKVRKFLQLSNNDCFLITDSYNIYGIGSIIGSYNPTGEDLFLFSFTGHHQWEVSHNSICMMKSSYGQSYLPHESIDRDSFFSDFKRIFIDINNTKLNLLWETLNEAIRQKHGTIVVISSEAENEAKRLGKQSFKIQPTTIDYNLISKVTNIDGAILISPECICHAIGVILDGVASDNGDSSRGARYNSAIRYYDTKPPTQCCILVVSEDGMIDFIPKLLPQIPKNSIDEKITELGLIIDTSDELFFKKFNKTMDWFKEHEFYLSQEQCDKINSLRKDIDTRIDDYASKENQSVIRFTRNDLSPNEKMNDSYFL
jgi:hypothetical protein